MSQPQNNERQDSRAKALLEAIRRVEQDRRIIEERAVRLPNGGHRVVKKEIGCRPAPTPRCG